MNEVSIISTPFKVRPGLRPVFFWTNPQVYTLKVTIFLGRDGTVHRRPTPCTFVVFYVHLLEEVGSYCSLLQSVRLSPWAGAIVAGGILYLNPTYISRERLLNTVATA